MALIYAEATPPGRGGISAIRISGDGARRVAERLAGPLERPRHAYLRTLREGNEILDQALVSWFEAGRSFTGEETAELQLHGAPVVVRRVGAALRRMDVRSAEAGEFTRRAFLAGKMDLAEVEGLGDLLAAETEAQRQQAARLASGELGRVAGDWRKMLIDAGALIEASVDFADEETPEEVPAEVFSLLQELAAELDRHIAGYAAAETIRSGFEVAIIGPPNAGKSSLLNRLARRDVALVSEIAGTTRDVIEARLDLSGVPVTFLDTAGLRKSSDLIESLGIDRARQRALAADLRVHLSPDGQREQDLWRDGDIVVSSKVDLREDGSTGVSALTGVGIDDLLTRLRRTLAERIAPAGLVSHGRQLNALVDARRALADIDGLPPEILAENIRACAMSLDRLFGRIGAEDYLDAIFTTFCIGK